MCGRSPLYHCKYADENTKKHDKGTALCTHTRHAIYKTPTLNSVEVVTRFKIFTAVMNIQEVMVYEVSTDIL